MIVTFDLADEAATARFAATLARFAGPGDVFALEGDLGSGKTSLARAFVRSLVGQEEEVPSPTFTLAQVYDYEGGIIWHFDLYRLEKADDALELGIEDAFSEGISLIEWPDRLGAWLPLERLTVTLLASSTAEARQVRLAGGPSWTTRLQEILVVEREHRIQQFLDQHGWGRAARGKLAGDASFRRYDRLVAADGHRVVLMDAPPPQEDVRPFVTIENHLVGLGYSAPRLLASDIETGLLLLEDLGDDTYTRLLAAGTSEESLYRLAVDLLIDLHGKGKAAIPSGLAPYDDQRLLTEALLLPDWYAAEINPLPASARDDYIGLWQDLFPSARAVPETLVLRDFHVDNLLRLDDRPGIAACGLLDFQDAVAGPVTYDLMSLLEDARRDIDPRLIASLRRHYCDAFPALDVESFDASWAVLAAQRHAKVIGIFTRLCRRDGKPIYLQHIPRLWRLLENALTHPKLSALKDWFDRHLPKDKRGVPQP
jgi:tRNA threonylcarbamoyl adenosine modification protein YjeE